MEFSLPAAALARAVGMVKGCVPSKTTIPILAHVLVEARAGEIVVRATNLNMEATCRSGADVGGDGAAALPGDVLHAIVKRMPKSAIVNVRADGARVAVTCKGSSYDLRALAAEEFPSAPRFDGGVTFSIEAPALKRMLDTTRYAAANDDTRPWLSGVFVHADGGDLVAAASNNHRFAKRSHPLPAGVTDVPGAIVPSESVRQISDMMTDLDGTATVTIAKSRLRVEIGDMSLATALIDGEYPQYQALIRVPETPTVTVKAGVLADAVDRAFAVYTGTDTKMPTARFVTGAAGLDLSAGLAGLDTGTEDVEAVVHERGAQFVVNARYLGDMLKLWPDVDLDIHAGPPGGPVLFTARDVPGAVHLIMTMRG